MKLRVADEVLTILIEAAVENTQIDKAMAAMGIAQKLKEVENVVVAPGCDSKSVQTGLAQTACQGILAGNLKTKVRYLESRLTWNISFTTGRATRMTGAWNAWLMLGQFWKAKVDFKFKCNIFKATIQRPTAVRLVRLFGTKWKLQRE